LTCIKKEFFRSPLKGVVELMTVNKDEQVNAERIRLLYKQTNVGIIATMVNAFILAAILYDVILHSTLIMWLAAVALTAFFRLFLFWRYRHSSVSSTETDYWKRQILCGITLSGITWGITGIILFPINSITHQVFIAFVVGGMVAGAAGTFSVVLMAFIAFSLPALVPIIIRMFLIGDNIHLAMGGMTLLFGLLMFATAKRLNVMDKNSIELGFENTGLIAYLGQEKERAEKVNEKLKLEVMERNKVEDELKQHQGELESIVAERTQQLTKTNMLLRQKIEERTLVEETLRKSEDKYRHIFENIQDAYNEVSMEGVILEFSPTIEAITHYKREELIGQSIQKIYANPKDRSEFLRELLNSGRVKDFEISLKDKYGHIIPCSTNCSLEYDENGVPSKVIGSIRDISKRKLAEEESKRAYSQLEVRVQERTSELAKANNHLKEEIARRKRAQVKSLRDKEVAEAANSTKSEFLANMSHELRTPLNHIIGFTELVVDKNFGDLNETQEEYLTDALHGSKHLLSLINDILDLSKVEAGKLELEPTDINLKMLLENSLIMITEKAMKHNVKLSTHIDGIPETITADERKLKQIMYNMLSNAVKFTPDGGSITLAAKLGTGYSVVEHGNADEQTSTQYPIPIEISSKFLSRTQVLALSARIWSASSMFLNRQMDRRAVNIRGQG
jgi:PAS domain S-box-containing protein